MVGGNGHDHVLPPPTVVLVVALVYNIIMKKTRELVLVKECCQLSVAYNII